MKHQRVLPIIGITLFSLAMAFTSAMHAQDASKPHDKQKSAGSQQTKYVRPTDPALYVGPDTCKTCHEELYNGFASSPHFATTMDSKLDARTGPEWHGCEACHGPGKEHVDGGGDVTKIFTFKDASPARDQCALPGLPPKQP